MPSGSLLASAENVTSSGAGPLNGVAPSTAVGGVFEPPGVVGAGVVHAASTNANTDARPIAAKNFAKSRAFVPLKASSGLSMSTHASIKSSWWTDIQQVEEMYLAKMQKKLAAAFRARMGRSGGASRSAQARRPPSEPRSTLVAAASGHCHPGYLLERLGPRLTASDVVCVDTGEITLWASLCLRLTRRSVVLSSERLGTMGYALCAGIAASLERGPGAKADRGAGPGQGPGWPGVGPWAVGGGGGRANEHYCSSVLEPYLAL